MPDENIEGRSKEEIGEAVTERIEYGPGQQVSMATFQVGDAVRVVDYRGRCFAF